MTEKNKNSKNLKLNNVEEDHSSDVGKNSVEDVENTENKELESLKAKVIGLEKVINEQNDKILRSLAEVENLRRRSAEDVQKANKYGISKFASDLVLVAESLCLAINNMPEEEIKKSEKLSNFAQGIIMTQKELIKIFEKHGIKRINPINERFDHNYHEAIASVECEGESGIVKKVIQAGYAIQDRLIRPALVEVSQ